MATSQTATLSQYLDAQGAAQYLAIRPEKIYGLVREGKLKAQYEMVPRPGEGRRVSLGRRMVFAREDLDALEIGGAR